MRRLRAKTSVASSAPVAALAFTKPSRRLCVKTKMQKPKQVPLVIVDDWENEEKTSCRRLVYLVTLPQPKASHSASGRKLVAPGSMSKEKVLQCLLDSAEHPEYTDGRSVSLQRKVALQQCGVWREFHQPAADGAVFTHDHVPVLAPPQKAFSFAPVKKALLTRHGLASHWSCTHLGYWSAVRYCSVPSPKKLSASLDSSPVLWASSGQHPPLVQCREEPMTAKALSARSEKKYMKAAQEGKAEKIDELDIWPIVVKNNFRNGPDEQTAHIKLIAHTIQYGSKALQRFLFKRRHLLPSLIDSIWQWETISDSLGDACRSRVDTLRLAAHEACRCGGLWPVIVVQSAIANAIDLKELCTDIFKALQVGRAETTPVLVLAGAQGGEGKSYFLKPLLFLYGDDYVFPCPEPGTFPLLDLPGKKVVFLDDWRFDKSVLPYATQCRWYDGSVLRVQRPQNQTGLTGHVVYRGSAPIFATTKLDDMERLEWLSTINPVTSVPYDTNASMCFRRLKVYKFRFRIPKPGRQIPYCPACFAKLVLSQAGA